jgi:hypothetical protein
LWFLKILPFLLQTLKYADLKPLFFGQILSDLTPNVFGVSKFGYLSFPYINYPPFYKIVKKNVGYLQKTLDNVDYLKYDVNRLQIRRQGMKMTEQEKGLMGLFRQVESHKNREDVLFYTQAILKAENALREDYGLVGPDMPLFNGTGPIPGPAA